MKIDIATGTVYQGIIYNCKLSSYSTNMEDFVKKFTQ